MIRLGVVLGFLVLYVHAAIEPVVSNEVYQVFDITPDFPGASRFVEQLPNGDFLHIDLGVQYKVGIDAYVARRTTQSNVRSYTWDNFIMGTVGQSEDIALKNLNDHPGDTVNLPPSESIVFDVTASGGGGGDNQLLQNHPPVFLQQQQKRKKKWTGTATTVPPPPTNLMRNKLQQTRVHQRHLMTVSASGTTVNPLAVQVGDEGVRVNAACVNQVTQGDVVKSSAPDFCTQYESRRVEVADRMSEIVDREHKILELLRAAKNQTQLLADFAQFDVHFASLLAGFINQTANDQATIDRLIWVLEQNRRGADTIKEMVDGRQEQLQSLVAVAYQTSVDISGAVGTLQQQVLASEQLSITERQLLSQSLLAQQSGNDINRVEGMFLLKTFADLQSIVQSLSNTLLAWMQRTTEKIALNTLVPAAIADLQNDGMVLFASSPGRPPVLLSASERYQPLTEFAFFYIPAGSHDGSIVRRTSWTFVCDDQFFALDTRPRDSFSSVEEWMGPTGCAAGFNGSLAPPPAGIACRCYSRLVTEQAVNAVASGALALVLNNTQADFTDAMRTPPPLDGGSDGGNSVVWNLVSQQYLFSLADFQAAWLAICLTDVENIVDVQQNRTGGSGAGDRSRGWVLRYLQDTEAFDTIVLDRDPTPTARPYCTTQLDLLTALVNLQAGGRTVASVLYNGLIGTMSLNSARRLVKVRAKLLGTFPVPAAVDTRRQAFSELGSLFDPGNLQFLSLLNVPPPIDTVNPPDSDIFISYRVDTLVLGAVSVDAVPILHFSGQQLIKNVWTSLSGSASEELDSNLLSGSSVVSAVFVGDSPIDVGEQLLPSAWNMAGYPACLFDPLCPIAPFALNASDDGRILSVLHFGRPGGPNRTRFTHTFDVESDELETSLQQSQRRHRPTLAMELVDSSLNGDLDTIYDGVARRRPTVTMAAMEAQTGNRFDPTEATGSLASYLVEVATNPFTGCIQCIGLRASANGVCRKLDLFCFAIDMQTHRLRLTPLSMNWRLQVTVRRSRVLPDTNILPPPAFTPTGCPGKIRALERDTDTTLLMLTDTTPAAPTLSLIVDVLRSPTDATGCKSQTLLLGPGTLTAFQTHVIQLATCSSLAVQVSTGAPSAGPGSRRSCWKWEARQRPAISIGGIPERIFSRMVAQMDQFGVILREIGVQLSEQHRATRTALTTLLGNVIRAASAAQARAYLEQMRQARQQYDQGRAALNAILLQQQSLFNTLAGTLQHLQDVANQIHVLDQAAITERLQELAEQQAQVAAILVRQQALVPQLAELANFQAQVTQDLVNANTLIRTAPPAFSWNDVGLYMALINTNCPATWDDGPSNLECTLTWYDPASWFGACLSGQWVGLSYLIVGLIATGVFDLACLLYASTCAKAGGRCKHLWTYVVLNEVPHQALSSSAAGG